MDEPRRLYECLLDYCSSTDTIARISIGLVWTVCQTQSNQALSSGLAMTPALATRTLKWPGTLAGQPLKDIGQWLLEWEPYQATVGMAAVNCSINNGRYLPETVLLDAQPGMANLTVFEHFLPSIQDQKVVVVGHYPGIERYIERYGWLVLERLPVAGDYPDPASEFLLPDADWVFLSASTIPNKTFPRLAELSSSAKTVLMGPTVPWLPELHNFGIDYLAGVEVIDSDALFRTAAEGGGVRIFETGVRYKILELTPETNLSWLKRQIAETFADKEKLTQAMERWYAEGNLKRFPNYAELHDANLRLSRMDSAYKSLWDATQQLKTG
ncbi:MAG: Rossmann-like domain-containing protein [Gammaproteobacteria bacterium]